MSGRAQVRRLIWKDKEPRAAALRREPFDMHPQWNPMRWPAKWTDPSFLSLLEGTSINYLLVEHDAALGRVVEQAQMAGIRVSEAAPAGEVTVVAGEWPGIQVAKGGAVTAGPTGAPWVDSNGWAVRLAAARNPKAAVWVEAAPREPRLLPQSYVMALGDTAVRQGRWIITLDDRLAAGLAARDSKALETWKQLNQAGDFFAAQKSWAEYVPQAVIGVVSDFAGENEFLSHELLNLLDRTNEQYRIILKADAPPSALQGLKAVICPDAGLPEPQLRSRILAFVEAGGLLIAGPQWGALFTTPAKPAEHPRYFLRAFGKGRAAIAKAELDDAYTLANDAVVLVSHQHDLLRFWNGGAIVSLFSMPPDRKRALVQMLFYSQRGNLQRGGMGEDITVGVAGRYRSARIRTLDQPVPRAVDLTAMKDSVEVHFSGVSHYAAVELEL